jgi:YHS domain-containing protein
MLIPYSKLTKWCFTGAFVLTLLVIGTMPGMAFKEYSQSFGVAIWGYDTVAYHIDGRAVKGKKKFSYEWNDATWRFASAENRDLFASDPERYAPQFGGY